MTASEILQKFNQYYVEIEKIAQSEEWQKLCQSRENDPEMKTHLGDVLHYLGEAIDCLSPTIPTITTCPSCKGVGSTFKLISIRDSEDSTPDEECHNCDGIGSIERWEVKDAT